MDVEWSVAAAADDPFIVVPWSDDASTCAFVDLRADPSAIAQVPEAAAWPELRAALLLLNAPASPVWTAKCDAWELSEEERALDFGPVAGGVGCYIDVFPAQPKLFTSLDRQLATIQHWTRAASLLPEQDASAAFVLRPAQHAQTAGFATTVYVYGYGETTHAARTGWASALAKVVEVILAETVE